MNHKTIIFTTIYIVAFAALAATGYMVGDYSFKKVHHTVDESKVFITDISYFDLPHMSMTLTDGGSTSSKLNLDLSLEVEGKNMERLKDYQPRITDRLTIFIHNQNVSDMRDLANQATFRNNLLQEANKASYPIPIMDIVFRRMLFM